MDGFESGRAAVRALRCRVNDLNALPLNELFAVLCGSKGRESPLYRGLLGSMRDEDLGVVGSANQGLRRPVDITTEACVPTAREGRAVLVAREEMTMAGLVCVPGLLEHFAQGVRGEVLAKDGETVVAGAMVAEFQGPMREVLVLERGLLNLVSRLSGVATMAAKFVRAIKGTRACVYDTRKTTPGLRVLEKYAVRCGGAKCHRIGLYDALLIKDNHLAGVVDHDLPEIVRGAVERAQRIAREAGTNVQFAELEVDRLEQLRAVLEAGGCGLDIVLLDNMAPAILRDAVAMRDRSGVKVELEASGGVRLDTVRAIAETGVERISAGAITHQAVGVDLGLDIE